MYGREEKKQRIQQIAREKIYVHSSTSIKEISSTYGFDFENPPLDISSFDFKSFKDQVLLIENWIVKHQEIGLREIIRLRREITELIHSKEIDIHSQIMTLGIIYFYLDRDGNVPSNCDYLKLRKDEIYEELKELEREHEKLANQTQTSFPSGKVHYLLRALTGMMVTTHGEYNRGGIFAAYVTLNEPTICAFFEEEHIAQMQTVIAHLGNDPETKRILSMPIVAHRDAKSLIQMDLKLLESQKIESSQIWRACVMSLLFDIRQLSKSNCFATASLVLLLHDNPLIVLKRLIRIVQQGRFEIDQQFFPLSFCAPQLLYTSKNDLNVTPSQMINHPIYELIRDSMEGVLINPDTMDSEIPLQTLLHETANRSDKKVDSSEKLLGSFNENRLQQALLFEMQLINLNKKETHKERFTELLMNEIYDFFEASFPGIKNSHDGSFFFNSLKINNTLFLLPNTNNHSWETDGNNRSFLKLTDGFIPDKVELSPKDTSLFNLFKSNSVIAISKGSQFEVIKTFDDFFNFFNTQVSELKELFDDRKMDDLANYVKNERFKFCESLARAIKKYDESSIWQSGYTSDDLLKLDRIILNDHGGSHVDLLLKFYPLSTTIVQNQVWDENFPCSSPKTFIETLLSLYQSIHETEGLDLSNSSTLFLAGTKEHTFTLAPYRIFSFLDGSFEEKVLKRGNTAQNKLVSLEVKKEILNFLEEDAVFLSEDQDFLNQDHTVRQFCDALLNFGFDESLIQDIFNKIFQTVPLKNIIINLFNHLNISLSSSDEEYLKRGQFRQERMEPRKIAIFIKQHFAQYFPKDIPLSTLENVLFQMNGLPEILDLGDLNYPTSPKEGPGHERLILKFDFVSGDVQFFTRNLYEDVILSPSQADEYLNRFNILYVK